MNRLALRSATLTFALLSLALIGCDGGGGAKVTGIVTLDGTPLPDAEVTIESYDREKGAGGDVARTDSAGKFTITSSNKKFGLKPGKYSVWVTKYVDKKTGQVPPPEEYEMQKAAGALVNKVHPRYSDREQGPLITFEIKGGSEDVKVELSSKPPKQ